MTTALVALWLALAFQPCVMASVQAMESAPCNGCPESHSMSKSDCQDASACASMMDEQQADVAGFARSVSPQTQPALLAWETIFPVVLSSYHSAFHDFDNPADPPPLKRFCILQI